MIGESAAPPVGPLRAAKQTLRASILARRDALDLPTRERASAAIAAAIVALDSYAAARTVFLFASFGSEWATRPVIDHAIAGGKRVVLPRVDRAQRMLVLHRVVDPDADLGPGVMGILEPLPRCEVVPATAIDWVMVPGLGFDRAGRRLGYGGGYYDRTLPTLSSRAARVVGAFAVQVVDEVPCGPHDTTIDLLLTERGIEFERSSPR